MIDADVPEHRWLVQSAREPPGGPPQDANVSQKAVSQQNCSWCRAENPSRQRRPSRWLPSADISALKSESKIKITNRLPADISALRRPSRWLPSALNQPPVLWASASIILKGGGTNSLSAFSKNAASGTTRLEVSKHDYHASQREAPLYPACGATRDLVCA